MTTALKQQQHREEIARRVLNDNGKPEYFCRKCGRPLVLDTSITGSVEFKHPCRCGVMNRITIRE